MKYIKIMKQDEDECLKTLLILKKNTSFYMYLLNAIFQYVSYTLKTRSSLSVGEQAFTTLLCSLTITLVCFVIYLDSRCKFSPCHFCRVAPRLRICAHAG